MKIIFLILLLGFFLSCYNAKTTWDQLENYGFEQYKTEFGKRYKPEEEKMRRFLFEKRLEKIRKHNADSTKSWKEGK